MRIHWISDREMLKTLLKMCLDILEQLKTDIYFEESCSEPILEIYRKLRVSQSPIMDRLCPLLGYFLYAQNDPQKPIIQLFFVVKRFGKCSFIKTFIG